MSWPDPEGAVRTFLRADAGVAAIVGTRVYFGIPKGADESKFPLVTVARVGGPQDLGEAPLDLPLLSIDCWGSIDASGNGVKSSATALVNAVRSALDVIRRRTTVAGGTDLFGVNVAGVVWAPDPDNDRPRYTATVEVTAMSS